MDRLLAASVTSSTATLPPPPPASTFQVVVPPGVGCCIVPLSCVPASAVCETEFQATSLMEWLIRRNIPQRTAHGIVGQLVRKALDQGVSLSELSVDEFKEAH